MYVYLRPHDEIMLELWAFHKSFPGPRTGSKITTHKIIFTRMGSGLIYEIPFNVLCTSSRAKSCRAPI